MSQNREGNRNALQVMAGLIGMVKPLLGFMVIAIIMGCIGNLMATFITVLGGVGIGTVLGYFTDIKLTAVFVLAVVFAVLRGILRYSEQACNHFIAFKLLAEIRHKVFACLRRLAPAKLDGRDKGNLISIITSDIELLEVFYAHTISPIAIAVITSVVMSLFIGFFDARLGLLAAAFYIIVGIVIPVVNSHLGQQLGQQYRKEYGALNTVVLDNLYGLEEILQYGQQKERLLRMEAYTTKLERVNHRLKMLENVQRIITDAVILTAGIVMALTAGNLVKNGDMDAAQAIVCTIAMMSSFGPTAALSALSNNLNQTLASGNRVLNLLAEEPVVQDIYNGKSVQAGDISAEKVTFSYAEDGRQGKRTAASNAAQMAAANAGGILKDFSLQIKQNTIHGILGRSGCGKSTLLKLMMRFYETESGSITYNGTSVNEIETAALRSHIAYVTQDTFLFSDTIENNMKVADGNATREMVMEAAKKAAIHDFIMSLPKGYDTKLSELGDSVSGGERQRIGLARAFLHQAQVILLDEPTSNIDSLNEAIILKSLKEERQGKTMVLVSHRASTMAIADEVTRMEA